MQVFVLIESPVHLLDMYTFTQPIIPGTTSYKGRLNLMCEILVFSEVLVLGSTRQFFNPLPLGKAKKVIFLGKASMENI